MFVQALAEYADRNLGKELDDVAFEDRPIAYFIEIAPDGRFLGIIPRFTEQSVPGKKGGKEKVIRRPQAYNVPRSPVNRNSGSHPILGADDVAYVLGVGPWTDAQAVDKVARHHDAFVALIARAAHETKDAGLQACERFYAQSHQVEQARAALTEVRPGDNIALSVDGAVTNSALIKPWWRTFYEAACTEKVSVEVAECLISGIVGPIPPTHPKIKHTAALGGQASGVSLMSFDKGAFRSYGWEQCANSPVSADRAMAYVLALNDLLKPGSEHRKDFDGVAFLFWLRKNGADSDPFEIVADAKPEQVKKLLDLHRPARSLEADPDPNLFYMAAVSANGSRLILRSWVTETLPRVKANLREWFKGLRITPLGANQQPSAPPLWQLLHAIDREGKPPAGRVVALVRRALEGSHCPLGSRILQDVLQRMRVDSGKRLNLPSLGLLRLCLNDLTRSNKEGELMSESLDPDLTHPAYLCGRLLALHDAIQWKTFDTAGETQPNSTVADRFYNLVMTSPALGMEKVFTLGRKHLGKLRRLHRQAAFGFEQRIGEIEGSLAGDIPRIFGMHDKARFALGFYHQKAVRGKKSGEAEPDANINYESTQEKESNL